MLRAVTLGLGLSEFLEKLTRVSVFKTAPSRRNHPVVTVEQKNIQCDRATDDKKRATAATTQRPRRLAVNGSCVGRYIGPVSNDVIVFLRVRQPYLNRSIIIIKATWVIVVVVVVVALLSSFALCCCRAIIVIVVKSNNEKTHIYNAF